MHHNYCSFAFNILLFFFSLLHLTLSFSLWCFSLSPLSLFISGPSLSPHWSLKQVVPLISEASSLSPFHRRLPPKLTHWCNLRSSLTVPPPITAKALFDQWVLGFWSFLILCLISFGIFCLRKYSFKNAIGRSVILFLKPCYCYNQRQESTYIFTISFDTKKKKKKMLPFPNIH